jgi:arylsulfatase
MLRSHALFLIFAAFAMLYVQTFFSDHLFGQEGNLAGHSTRRTSAPNVLIVLCDDLGFSDIGVYGGEISTPNLDRLAQQGRRFTQFYNTARCWPTRAALLTGYYAQQVRRDTVPGIPSGGSGKRPDWAVLLPQRLQAMGYRSYHSGKWHIDGLPTKNGFHRSYSLQDHDRHFYPRHHTSDDHPLPAVNPSESYYSSTAIAQYAIDHLQEHFASFADQPFFSFVAFTAPHFPMQAPQDIVQRYRTKYRSGWDVLRQERWDRMKHDFPNGELSAIERDVGPPYPFPEALAVLGPGESNRPNPWEELTPIQREFQIDKMAVHAAMVEVMDTEIGRILDCLKRSGQLENTCVFFLSDNGASAEIMVRGDGHNPDAPPGSAESFLCLGPGWSSLSNTPFRRHKTWVHEGGIATPMIVSWPDRIAPDAKPIDLPAHVIDIVPTVLSIVAESDDVQSHSGSGPTPPGATIAPLLVDHPDAATTRKKLLHRNLWWKHEGNRAIRQGNLKLVAAGETAPWELYDLETDRTESHDLARERPQSVEQLSNEWKSMRDAFHRHAQGMVATE